MSELHNLTTEMWDAYHDGKAYYGDGLEDLIGTLENINYAHISQVKKLEGQLEQVQQERLKLLEASKVQSAEIQTRDGATRKASIGQVVLFKAAKYGRWVTALIQEVYGFPPGKVGLRVLGREPQKDSFEYAYYDADGFHVGPTWKWLDE